MNLNTLLRSRPTCIGLGGIVGLACGLILGSHYFAKHFRDNNPESGDDVVPSKQVRSVVITSWAKPKRIVLTPEMQTVFMREFVRVTKEPPWEGRPGERVGGDCEITITYEDGSKNVYQILARAVLYEPATDQHWQFYMGYFILEWLGEGV